MRPSFDMYHGSHRWTGPAEIRALRRGHAEHGPGIYFTSSRETAGRYAKGGGRVSRFTIEAPRAWADEVRLDADEAKAWVKQVLSRKPQAREDIAQWIGKHPSRVYAETLINLFVNRDIAHGETGTELAKYLVSQGADATRVRAGSGETWVVTLNPEIVRIRRSVEPGDPWDLDTSAIKSMLELAKAGQA